ncbi:hypothetical protein P2318_02570 [Myxococcaceae bacterium GXIMD 01537]
MEKHEYLTKKMMGPDPHARSALELARAYGYGVSAVAPQVFLNPWMPRPALKELVSRRLRAIATHAARKVPFYREHFARAGVQPESLRSVEDFARLPLLTKDLLKANSDRMLAEDAPPREQLLERSSSGSSGAPVRLFFDPLKELPRRVQELRLLTSHGYRLWQTQLVFDHPGHLAPKPFLPQRLGLWRRMMFPSWLGVDEALKLVNAERPHVLHGVLSSLRMVALAVKASGGLGYKPSLLVSKGELLDAATRSLIETSLGAPLVDYYATEETGIIAWQCPSGAGYHIDQDFVHVETLTPDGEPTKPGEVGEICLTNLYMRAMPFIRYRVGDLGALSPEPCPCGRGLPLLKNLHGRRVDLILTPEGEIHHPFALMVIMEEVPEVVRYRLQQVALDRIIARVNWQPGMSAEDKEAAARKVREGFHERLGASVRVEVEEVETFTHGMGEKFPLVQGLGRASAELASRSYSFRF